MGNGEAKEHVYDPWTWTKGREGRWEGSVGQRGIKGEKWDNCNRIITKIYLKKRKKFGASETPSIT